MNGGILSMSELVEVNLSFIEGFELFVIFLSLGRLVRLNLEGNRTLL